MRPMLPVLLFAAGVLVGCDQTMENQPRYATYGEAPEWPDRQAARRPVEGTIARGDVLQPPPEKMPLALTTELLKRGQQQYETFCTPCHGATGAGDGMIVQRGFPAPPTYHSDRLRASPLSHFYEVISKGYGVMYSYAARVAPDDRWAIAAYIRALQLSQHASISDLSDTQRARLDASPAAKSSPTEEGSRE